MQKTRARKRTRTSANATARPEVASGVRTLETLLRDGIIIEARRAHYSQMVPCEESVVLLNPTEGFVVTEVDENGNESFSELVAALEGEWDATERALDFVGGSQRVYEIAAVILTGRELRGPAHAEGKAVRA